MSVRFKIEVLGCPKNECDAEGIAGRLISAGATAVDKLSRADAVILMTCGFTDSARDESQEHIQYLGASLRPGQRLYAFGCLVSRLGGDTADLPGLAGAFPVDSVDELVRAVCGELPAGPSQRFRLEHQPYAYLKLADGCDRRCAFCSIPLIKGHMLARPMAELTAESRLLAADGVRELVLVSQDTTAYARSVGLSRFGSFLDELADTEGIERLRLMYLYPEELDDEMVSIVFGRPAVAAYLDLPLQHVNGAVLKSMNRAGDLESRYRLVERLRRLVPGAAIRTSFIVGHPGEGETEFDELLDFVEEIAADWTAVFTYSPEKGTAAVDLPRPSRAETVARYNELSEAADASMAAVRASRVGLSCDVIIEGRESGLLVGRGPWEAPEIDGRVLVESDRVMGNDRAKGDIIRCLMTGATDLDLTAQPAS